MSRLRLGVVLPALALCAALAALVPAAIAADSGTIAFSCSRGGNAQPAVCTMAADGSDVKRLGTGEDPSISRDGKKIVFVKTPASDPRYRQVFVMDSDGTSVRQLTDDQADDSQPVISPDGKEIAYVGKAKVGPKGGDQIFLMTISGSDPIQLTQSDPNHPSVNSEPSFSPNGNRIVFINNAGVGTAIETMKTDGSDRTAVRKDAPFAFPSHPSYAPDGRRMVFAAQVKRGRDWVHNVYTFNPDNGADLDKVNKGDTEAFEPAYSPDSRWIAFRRGDKLVKVAPDGSHEAQLTDGGAYPSWGR